VRGSDRSNCHTLTLSLGSPGIALADSLPAELQARYFRNDGNPLIDGRGSRRRMRGLLDVVERERQGQEDIFVCQVEEYPFDLFTGP
jgi:hypothetical protein